MKVGDDRHAQALQGRRIGGHIIFGQAQAVGNGPEDCAKQQKDGRSRKREDEALQNLIFARESTDTAEAPFWPCGFSW